MFPPDWLDGGGKDGRFPCHLDAKDANGKEEIVTLWLAGESDSCRFSGFSLIK
jgi:hypothetical protein